MVGENKETFEKFTKVHLEYSQDPDSHQDKFNKEGEKIMEIIHEWEDRLCKQSEKAGFGNYTGPLAEKFQAEVKSHFPLIDYIGIIPTAFSLKRIKLEG